jgi:CHAT domain-containing protein
MDSALSVLSPIKGTREEINLISSYFSTRKFFDERATESVFKEKAGDYSLLHLAMHTIIDDQNPLYSKLVFTITPEPANEDGFLNTYELFNLEMQGELAVLSACNTGTGKLERGEGIISLARGFFYAGIPSVVMTLWEVEDHSSAELMGLFYKYLQKGLPKDVALQSAKIEYLDKAGKLQSHPYFWAGFVNIGSSSPIVKDRMATYKILLFTGIAIIILLLVYYLVINKRVYFKKKAL